MTAWLIPKEQPAQLTPGSGASEEEVGGTEEPENEECCEFLPSGYDVAIALSNLKAAVVTCNKNRLVNVPEGTGRYPRDSTSS